MTPRSSGHRSSSCGDGAFVPDRHFDLVWSRVCCTSLTTCLCCMPDPSLRLLIIDQNVTRAAILEDGLREAGHTDVVVVRDMQNLLKRIVDVEPDVIFIDLENPNRDVLEQMFQVSRVVQRPIAMFVDHSDTDMIRAAVESGVGAYIVDGLRKERVKSILDT